MNQSEELFNTIATELPEAKEGKMFGALCIKAPNGKAAVMYWKDDLIVKLTGEAADEALSLDVTQVFTPMENKPMNGWIQVPYTYAPKWRHFAREAYEYVSELKK